MQRIDMIDRCNHGDVTWDGIRESTGTTRGKAVGTCGECGATVASTLSGLHEIEPDDDEEELETKVPIEAGRA